jgi:hypothetical protein
MRIPTAPRGLLLVLCLVAASTPGFAATLPGFAVVELFTSEGCSSCPPADEALARISQAAAAEHAPLYVLEWHVDYWDYLGWKDPYSSAAATARQQAYAKALGSSLYTPQAVLNGWVVPDWAGDQNEVEADAGRLMAAPSPASLSLAVSAVASGTSLRVHADARGAPRGSVIIVALAEDRLSSHPTAGENAGRTLTHSSVVRSATTLPGAGGDAIMAIPAGVDLARAQVIAFVQDPATMRIGLAARATIAASAAATAPTSPAAAGSAAPAAAAGSGRVNGRVVDARGQGIAGVHVQVCSDKLCIPAVTDSGGYFALDSLAAASYTVALPDAAPLVGFTLATGQSAALGDLVVPEGPAS